MEKLNTPWGYADQVDEIGDKGILFVSTPSHGGLFVPDELITQMPAELRGSNSYSGKGNWFEEDCEWAIPVLAFPEEFSPEYCKAAVETANMYRKNIGTGLYFDSVGQWLATPASDAVMTRAGLPIVGSSNTEADKRRRFEIRGISQSSGETDPVYSEVFDFEYLFVQITEGEAFITLDQLLGLEIGQSLRYGGGAAPLFELKRVEDCRAEWRVSLRKFRSTWHWFTANPQGGGFGSSHQGSKRVAQTAAFRNIPRGALVEIVTEHEGRQIKRELVTV